MSTASTERTSALRAQLSHPKSAYRRDAILAVARLNAVELLPEIAERFQFEPDSTVKAKCAWLLGHLRYAAARDIFKGSVRDEAEEEEVRVWAAWAIGELCTTRDEGFLKRLLAGAKSPALRRAIGGALKKAQLESVRTPASQLQRQLQPPKAGDPRIRNLLVRLEALEQERSVDLARIVELRRAMRSISEDYFRSYMEWVRRKPAIERALTNPKAVYGN